jgi:hypothetical protein
VKTKILLALATLALALLPVASSGCSGVDEKAYASVDCPPFGENGDAFRPVSAVIERRCGTLDCHGNSARPMRIYGQYTLRRPEEEGSKNVKDFDEYFTGGKEPTTEAELADNYQGMCALEPEIMARVVAKKKGSAPEDLTLVRKPRLLEKHKGGLLWNKGDDGDTCLVNWILGDDDTSPCDKELLHR